MIRRTLLLAVVIMCRLAHAARSSCFFSLFLCARVDLCVVTVGLLYEFLSSVANICVEVIGLRPRGLYKPRPKMPGFPLLAIWCYSQSDRVAII